MAAEGTAGLAAPVADVEALRRRASALKRESEAATRRYDRTAWIRYVALWVPIPLMVLAFKLRMEAWHYYVVGALFAALAAVIYAIDMAAVAARDRAIDAADAAQAGYEEALRASRRDHG